MKKRTFISFIAFFLANFFTLAIFAAVQPEQLPANQGDTSTSLAPFSLTSHNPTTNAIGIPLNTAVTATFDANVAPASVTTTTFAAHTSFGGLLTGTLSVSGNTITLNPNRNFFTGELVQIIATAGISSTDGISLTTPTQWEFITGPVGPLNRCAGGFTPVTTNLTPVRDGSVAWGDYDNDGDLDLLLAGESTAGSISQVYRNDNNVFTDIAAGLVGADDSSVAWGDYDNDGDLDILLVGSSFIAKVYRNDAGIFTDINAGLDGASRGSVDWGDYDNDGDLDILLTGGFGVAISRVYRNDNGAFVDIGAGLTGVELSSVDWGDYDNDGDLDILLSGDNFGRVSHVYRNDAGVFTNIGAGLETVRQSSVDWGDYDDDGDLDILLTGFNGVTSISHIYRNDAGTFTNINAGLSGLTQGHSAWGDYDNDGDLDILMTGLDIASTETTTKLYRNDAGSFTAIDAGLTNVQLSSVAWGDYDNDGDLDILLTGQDTSFTRVAQLYRNDDCSPISLTAQEPVPNAVGVAITPTISATFDGDIRANSVTDSAFIAHTNFTGVVTGTLAVINDTVTFDLSRNLFTGEQVQLIVTDEIQRISDNRRSAPTQWGFTAGPVTSRCVQDFTELSWTGLTGASNSSAAWGDYDNDGDLDMVVIGRVDFATLMSTIYRNDGTAFTDIGAGLTPVEFGRVAWGDYDNDGDLDILLTGFDGSVQLSQIYRNDAGSFTNINASLLPTVLGDIAWGDYDNDGDLDILLTGANGSTKISRIYRNDDGAFTDIGAGLAGVRDGAVAWGDYDNDGDLDILLTGLDFFNAKISKLYRNDNGLFTEVSTSLIGVDLSSVAWGDYDNDGDLDILLSGQVNGSTRVLKVYRNDNGVFTDLALPISGIKEGMVSWGDYDNDGDLDILFAGTGPGGRTTRIYDNDGGLFTDINAGLPGIGFGFGGTAAWGDVDTDGDLDILIVGSSNNGQLTTVYRNNDCPVEADVPLTVTVVGTDVELTWPDIGVNCVHDIYESTSPYTPPTVVTYANQTSGLLLPRTGDVNNNYYFIVESTCDGNVIGSSQEAGEFDFAITN